MDNPLGETSSNNGIPVVKKTPAATPSKFNSADKAISSPKQNPVIPNPKSLNPFAPEFEISPFARYDPYYPAHYEPYEHQQPRQGKEVRQTSNSPDKLTVKDSLSRLANVLSQRRLQDTLPLPEPEIFSGDLLHYPVWLKSFETIIEGQTDEVLQRLYYLGKYTAGEPKEAVSGPLLLETEDAYKKARKILSDWLGNPFLVADACREKINEWPKIPPDDGTSLRKLSDFLTYCQKATSTMKYLNVLNDPDENQRKARKLPRYLIDRWSREVDWLNKDEEQRQSGRASSNVARVQMGYPPFSAFCSFLQRESRIAYNPVTAVRPQREEVAGDNFDKGWKPKGFNIRKPPRFSTFATDSHEIANSNTQSRKEKKSEATLCPLCKAPHDLDVCKQFLKKSLAKRRDLIKTNTLCIGCLRWKHMKRVCRRRLVWKTCNGFQPTSLQSDPVPIETERSSHPRNTPEAISHRVNLSDLKNVNPSYMLSLIVPVWIHHRKDISKTLLTNALLDEQSDACFVKENLLRELGVNGPEVELKLSTVLAEKIIKSRRIEGLVVHGCNQDIEIRLPKSYSRSSIPARKSQIRRPESAMIWPHLQKISEMILPLNEDLRVGLLIGLNCSRAVKPLEVIPGKGDDPYAKRIALGWGIIGATRSSREEDSEIEIDIAGNRIVIYEVEATPNRKMCHLAFRTQVKEMISPSNVSKMFTLDFNERQADEKPLSDEDRSFLRIVREGIHQLLDDHYEIPLPLWNENLEPPNDKEIALSRLTKLIRRLSSEDQFRKDYCRFMEDIISNGCAQRVPLDEISTASKQVWYIPHHGVYHKKKPGKIRVWLQSTMRWPISESTTIPGPRCDKQSHRSSVQISARADSLYVRHLNMFHQVKIDIEHRNLLRFLWWDNPELKGDPVEFCMTVHSFGATSSPRCATFALKTTAD